MTFTALGKVDRVPREVKTAISPRIPDALTAADLTDRKARTTLDYRKMAFLVRAIVPSGVACFLLHAIHLRPRKPVLAKKPVAHVSGPRANPPVTNVKAAQLVYLERPDRRFPMFRYSSIEAAVQAIAEGRVVIAVDSEDRENEGDFLAAAEMTTPAMIHFMVSQGRGQLCMPVAPSIAQRLELTPMVACTDLETPRFAVPLDHRQCKTGISPLERARTIQAMIDPFSGPRDFVRPGHIFPLIAREEGVLRRPGHTEAAVDLARLAGLAPAGVLCEICSRDGLQMASGQELWEIAREFQLLVITVDDLIDFRRSMVGSQEEQLLVLSELAGM